MFNVVVHALSSFIILYQQQQVIVDHERAGHQQSIIVDARVVLHQYHVISRARVVAQLNPLLMNLAAAWPKYFIYCAQQNVFLKYKLQNYWQADTPTAQ